MNINLDHLWTCSEDNIIALLRNDILLNLSTRDISRGLFYRSKSSVAGRILILRRKKRVL